MGQVTRSTRFTKPIVVPALLVELQGPVKGQFTIPHRLYWPHPEPVTVDLSKDGEKTVLYAAVMTEGTLEDLREMVNGAELIRLWGELGLSPKVLGTWGQKFPQLRKGFGDGI